MEKKEIRKKIKSILNEKLVSSSLVLKGESDKICKKILELKEFNEADLILGFMPLKTEVSIIPILERALFDGKKIAIPKIIAGTSMMDFYFLNENQLKNQLKPGEFGIFEPDESFEKMEFEKLSNKSGKMKILILVPGLAFTKSGDRLGRGKGFYDIFLDKFETYIESNVSSAELFKVGICYSFQILEQIPISSNDKKMDCVIF